MAVGSGIGSQLGVAVESVYGTYVAPTRFYEAQKPQVSKVKNTTDWDGLAAGRLTQRADGRSVTTRASQATIDALVVTNRDMGLLLSLIMGGTPAGTPDAGTPQAFTYLLPLIDTLGKSASVQAGVPLIGGTVVAQSGLGCKVTDAEFSCGVDDLLSVTVGFDGQDVVDSQALAAASYPVGRKPFHFGQMAVKIGATVGTVASVSGVRKVDLKIARALRTDQFYAGASGLKAEPTTNGKVKITGTIDVDYKVAADFANRFRDDTQFALVWEFIGANINSVPTPATFRVTIPAAFLNDGTPTVDGPDVVTTSFNFDTYDDQATGYPAQITYITQDTAL